MTVRKSSNSSYASSFRKRETRRIAASTSSDSTQRDNSTTRASLQPYSDIPDLIPADFQLDARQSPTEIELVPIEQIKVGKRVPAMNPEAPPKNERRLKIPIQQLGN